MSDRPPLRGVPAWTGPDSPQSSVPLCPVCLHSADSPAHRAAARRMERLDAVRRDAEMRKRKRDADNARSDTPEP